MNNLGKNAFDLGRMDSLANGDSPVHSLDPRAKLATTIIFIITVVSFDKYAISSMMPFFLYPFVMAAAAGLPAGYIAKKIILVAPFAVLVGLFNPLIDTETAMFIGPYAVSGGWVSFTSIMMRFLLTVSAALILLAVTGFNAICEALLSLGAPKVFVVQLMFFYRYMFTLMEEAGSMLRAIAVRSFRPGAVSLSMYAPLAGSLLLRTLDRAERIYTAMACRGFDGHVRMVKIRKFAWPEISFTAGWIFVFALFRFCEPAQAAGKFFTEILK